MAVNETLSKAKADITVINKKYSDSQAKNRSFQGKIKELEEEIHKKTLDLTIFRKKIDQLTEELSSGSPFPHVDPPKSVRYAKRPSFIGLAVCDSEEEESEVSEEEWGSGDLQGSLEELNSEERSPSYTTLSDVSPRTLTLSPPSLLSIPPKPKDPEPPTRRDPGQEYFALVHFTQASQAVKLNSPYMDTICTVPTKELYEKALKTKVPFHKVRNSQWHIWIESQLTNAYLESIYCPQVFSIDTVVEKSTQRPF